MRGGFSNLKRRILILLGVIALCSISIFVFLFHNSLQNKIIKYIDGKCYREESCVIIMNEVTKFEWDIMIIYQVDSSSAE